MNYGQFKPAWWATNRHVATIVSSMMKYSAPNYERERWETPDDDFVDVDWVNKRIVDRPNQNIVVMFHGLEGSSHSTYCKSVMKEVIKSRWTGVVINWRSCSGEMNRQPTFYHSGFTSEVTWIVEKLKAEFPQSKLHLVGVSLGGNVILKWLGEQGEAAQGVVERAYAICPPHNLELCTHVLKKGFNRLVYMNHFMTSLKRKALQKSNTFKHLELDQQAILKAKTFAEFDALVTAPLHGFSSAKDYWRKSSCGPFLKSIAVPTMVLNTLDDPIIPGKSLTAPSEVSDFVRLNYQKHGGHIGFISGTVKPFPNTLAINVLAWLKQK